MNREEYLARFKELTELMYSITQKKNADYTGDDSSPFKNFTMVERMGFASTEQGFLTRITDKVMRVSSFVKNGTLQVVDEKVTDTLLDCANYCLLMICYLESKKDESRAKTLNPMVKKFNCTGCLEPGSIISMSKLNDQD